ncbi:MAG: ABC transporter permease, partial [Shimia sp.]
MQLVGIDPFTYPPTPATPDLTEADDLGAFIAGRLVFAHPDTRLPPDLPPARTSLQVPVGQVLADITTAWDQTGRREITHFVLAPGAPPGAPDGYERIVPQATGDVGRLTDSFHLNL